MLETPIDGIIMSMKEICAGCKKRRKTVDETGFCYRCRSAKAHREEQARLLSKAKNLPVRNRYSETALVARFRKLVDLGLSYRTISKGLYSGTITFGDVGRALQGVFPRATKKRSALGLPLYGSAPACPRCGQVHVTKRCTATRPHYRSLFAMTARALRQALESREEY